MTFVQVARPLLHLLTQPHSSKARASVTLYFTPKTRALLTGALRPGVADGGCSDQGGGDRNPWLARCLSAVHRPPRADGDHNREHVFITVPSFP